MKTIQTKSGEVLLVKVPEDAYDFRLLKSYITYKYCENETVITVKNYSINSKKFIFIGKFSELEDEDFEKFVEYDEINGQHDDFINGVGWMDYVKERYIYYSPFTPKESFQSLCKSQGIEDDLNNYLIINKL
jgi:hypothetical protein